MATFQRWTFGRRTGRSKMVTGDFGPGWSSQNGTARWTLRVSEGYADPDRPNVAHIIELNDTEMAQLVDFYERRQREREDARQD